MAKAPDRNLAVELVRVTEAASMAAARWIGRGDKNSADQAAVDAMRLMLQTVEMDGVVVIGEGEKDQAPMLFNGEAVGSGRGPLVDVAVDPLEGTELAATGLPCAISVIAVSERGTMFYPPTFYMEKIAAGREGAAVIDLAASATENVGRVAEASKKSTGEVTVVVLNRERNQPLVDELRSIGARVHLIPHGDTEPAIAAAQGRSGIDLVMGIGGSTEGILAAAAVRALGGAMQVRLWPIDDAERSAVAEAGLEPGRVLVADELVGGDDIFVAETGVTPGSLLEGVRYSNDGATTESLVMRSRSGTARWIRAEHQLDKLARFTGLDYR